MQLKQTAISAAIVAVLGISSTIEPASAAFTGADGEYDLVVLPTATKLTSYGGTAFKIGKDGNWQSSFTFGGLPSSTSNGMTDTDATVNGNGSGIAGDGFAGILPINISGSTFSILNFSKDTIFATAGGDFAQYLLNPSDVSQMSGTIDGPTGTMVYTPTERYGAINAPVFNDNPWNVNNVDDPSNTDWGVMTTESISNNNGAINGSALTNVGDTNGDGIDDFEGILVSGDTIGTSWGNFATAQYFEVWRINLLARAINDSATASTNAALIISVLANDGVGGGTGPLTVVSSTNGTLGTTTVTGGGTTVTYTAGAIAGTDSFTYTTQDGNGTQSTATVNITVTSNPVAAGDDGPFSGNQGATLPIAISDLTANDSSTAGNIVDASLTPASPTAQGGTAIVNGTNVDYTPLAADFVGSDTFTYTVQDTAANTSDPATVSIDITAYGITDAGTYSPGALATSVGSTNGKISADDLPPDSTVDATCVGGCYDFVVTGAANPTQIVVTELSTAITEGLLMRKNVGGTWQDYDTTTTGDAIASAPLSVNGGCPVPADASWVSFNGATTSSANAGHTCLKYTIADNGAGAGPNDSDPAAGTIADPSGLSSPITQSVKSDLRSDFEDNDSLKGGCAISATGNTHKIGADWLLLGGFLGFLGWLRRKPLN